MIFLLLAYLAILGIELPVLLKRKEYRDLIVFGVIYAGAFTLSLLLFLGIEVPSPMLIVSDFMKKIHLTY